MPHFRGEPPILHPAFPPGGPASVITHADGPVAFDSPRIVYSKEDERALEAFAYANGAYIMCSLLSTITHPSFIRLVPGTVATGWHSVSDLPIQSTVHRPLTTCLHVHLGISFAIAHQLGTCAMKPRNQGGVVDAKLNVYGVHGLKVADISVAPGNVSANTYGTALVIGEKAAVIIAEELGIKGVV